MNNMTRDPNQDTRPSIFGFEPYPPLNFQPIDWSRVPVQPPAPQGQFNPSVDYQSAANFQFCTAETPHPAQFPFPIEPSAGPSHGFNFSASRCKRKTESPPLQPYKQHITEERMAEHMSKLHISSETVAAKESDSDRTRRLYVCEEMRKLQNDSILPQSLLARIHRPCTALVLWTPPRRLLPPPLEDDSNGNNNEEAVPDANIMELDNV